MDLGTDHASRLLRVTDKEKIVTESILGYCLNKAKVSTPETGFPCI